MPFVIGLHTAGGGRAGLHVAQVVTPRGSRLPTYGMLAWGQLPNRDRGRR